MIEDTTSSEELAELESHGHNVRFDQRCWCSPVIEFVIMGEEKDGVLEFKMVVLHNARAAN